MRRFDHEVFENQRKKISGKWKPVILCTINSRSLRFNKIKQLLPLISGRILSQCLKELELNGMIEKKDNLYKNTTAGSNICLLLISLNDEMSKLP